MKNIINAKTKAENFFGICIIFSLIVMVGCTKTDTATTSSCSSATSYSGTYSNLYTKVFSVQCISCHSPGKDPYTYADGSGGLTGLSFESAAIGYSDLNAGHVSGVQSGDYCQKISYVSSGSPTTSYLMAVLSANYSTTNFAGQTNCTPLNSHQTAFVSLCAPDVTALESWIQSGAPNN